MIFEFRRANVAPEDEKKFGTIAANLYGMSPMKREGKSFTVNGVTYSDYFAMKLSNLNTGKGTNECDIPQCPYVNKGINPRADKPKDQPSWALRGVLGHPGGAGYNWSEGCQTIYTVDYVKFMELFAIWGKDEKGKPKIEDYNYNLIGFYFLLTQ